MTLRCIVGHMATSSIAPSIGAPSQRLPSMRISSSFRLLSTAMTVPVIPSRSYGQTMRTRDPTDTAAPAVSSTVVGVAPDLSPECMLLAWITCRPLCRNRHPRRRPLSQKRWKSCRTIVTTHTLRPDGSVLVSDLHHPGCEGFTARRGVTGRVQVEAKGRGPAALASTRPARALSSARGFGQGPMGDRVGYKLQPRAAVRAGV